MAVSNKIWAKAIIAGKTINKDYIKELSDYYLGINIYLKDVFGGNFYAEEFFEILWKETSSARHEPLIFASFESCFSYQRLRIDRPVKQAYCLVPINYL